jgi:O-antigen ligase
MELNRGPKKMDILSNSLVNLKSSLRDNIAYYITIAVLVLIPVYHWYLPPFMGLLAVIWIWDYKTRIEDFVNLRREYKLLFVLFIIFYLWQVFGMVYSDNPKEGWRNIILRISLFVFPLVYISPGEVIRKKSNFLLRIFALGTIFFLIFCLSNALYRSISFQNGIFTFNPHPLVYFDSWLNYFYGSELAIFQHPSYLSMYILFSVFISAESSFDKALKLKTRALWFTAAILLAFSIYLLSSRAAIIAAIITIPIYLFYKFRNSRIKLISGVIILIGLFILIPVVFTSPRLSYYFKGVSKTELINKMRNEGRIKIWKSALKILNDNLVFGVGTGDIQDELNKEYILSGDKNIPVKNNLNAHNQFLEVILENGLIGLLLFMSLFGVMLYISITECNILYTVFLFVVFISFLFETMLNRLAGVSFFSLFSFLLLHINMKDNNLNPI